MNNFLLLLLLLLLSIISFVFHGKRLGPSNFLYFPFIISLFVVLANSSYFNHQISLDTIIILFIFFVLFLIAELYIGNIKVKHENFTSPKYEIVLKKKIVCLAYFVVLLNLYLRYKYVMEIGSHYGASNLLSSLAATRLSTISYQDSGIAEVRYPFYFIIVDLLARCAEIISVHVFLFKKIISNKFDITQLGIATIYIFSLLLNTGRAPLFPVIVHVFYLIILFKCLKENIFTLIKRNIFKIALLSITGVFLFLIMGSIRQDRAGEGEIEIDPSTTIATYVGAPVLGLDLYVRDGMKESYYFGEHTFRDFYDYARIFGAQYKRTQYHKDDFYVGKGSSNVYTGFYYWISDFSLYGAFVYCIFIGSIFGVIYTSRIRCESISKCYISSYFYYAILQMFFNDPFNSVWSVNMILTICVLIYFQKKFFIIQKNLKNVKQ